METFSALLALCAGNSPVTCEFPTQRPMTWSFDVFSDLRLNKQLRKQSRSWWFVTPLRSLWCHCNNSLAATYSDICPIWMWSRRSFKYFCFFKNIPGEDIHTNKTFIISISFPHIPFIGCLRCGSVSPKCHVGSAWPDICVLGSQQGLGGNDNELMINIAA